MLQHVKTSKAMSEDLVHPALLKRFHLLLAEAYHPVLYKSACFISSPFQWKGGQLCEHFKNKGVRELRSNYRDIMLADSIGKQHNVPHLSLMAVQQLPKQQKLSFITLYADVCRGFASASRYLAFQDLPDSKETFIVKLRKLAFNEQQIQQAIAHVESFDPWHAEGQAGHRKALATEAHTHTWASFELLNTILATTEGVLAGTSWADLAFGVIMTRTLVAAREALAAEDLIYVLPHDHIAAQFGEGITVEPDKAVLEVSYVDDAAFFILVAALYIVQAARRRAEILQAVFALHGLLLNFAPGKTEAQLEIRGKRSDRSKQQVFVHDNSQIQCTSHSGEIFQLHCCQIYKHLDSQTRVAASLTSGIKCCASAMAPNMKGLQTELLANKDIPDVQKVMVASSVLMTKCLYNAACWPQLPHGEYRMLHKAVLKSYRRMTPPNGFFYGLWMSDQDVLNYLLTPPPHLMLVVMRMCLLVRIIAQAPAQLLMLLTTRRGPG